MCVCVCVCVCVCDFGLTFSLSQLYSKTFFYNNDCC